MYMIIGADGREYGPVTEYQLRQWIAEGRIVSGTRARVAESTEWKTVGSIPEFAGALAEAASHGGAAGVPASGGPPQPNPMAITGLVMGCVGVFGGLCCGPVFSPLGIVFSSIGLSQINKNPTLYTGKGIAIGGLCLSIFGLLIWVAMLIFFGVMGFLIESTEGGVS